MENRIAKNRKSPSNESAYIQAYLEKNPSAKRKDGFDVSCVIAKDGTKGHGLLPSEINRSHDNDYHRVKSFIPDSQLKKK